MVVAGVSNVQEFNYWVQLQVPMWWQKPETDTYVIEGSIQTAAKNQSQLHAHWLMQGPYLSVSALGMMHGDEAVLSPSFLFHCA